MTFLPISFTQESHTFHYWVGHSAPDTLWKEQSFDDSAWLQGSGSIGYGDGDDSIVIAPTTSLYIRHHLTLTENSSDLKGIIIYPNFDDGFIAYLNTVEILRVNVADSAVEPGFQQTTTRSHEAFGYREDSGYLYHSGGYLIDSATLAACEPGTQNILAFAVFNDSVDGSDLSFGFDYEMVDSAFFQSQPDLNFLSTNIPDSTTVPILVITTDEFGLNEENSIGHLGIINDSTQLYQHLNDTFTDYDGRIRIKLHGAYSLQFPKKSLRIELQDSLGENNNVSILGLPEENDFILYAPFQDRTLIKNVFTYTLGRKMGYYAPRTRYCEVVLNGTNLGLYVLTEKIKRDKNRVDIKKLDSTEVAGKDVTGGYLLQYNSELQIEYPKPGDITPEQLSYITNFIDQCEDKINHIAYCEQEYKYREVIDIQSLADYFLINELSCNFDAFNRSWYMYKDRMDVDPKLKYGPLWDYNVAWMFYREQWYDGWFRPYSSILSLEKILRDTVFTHLTVRKWENHRKGILSDSALTGLMDSIVTAIAPAIERNYQIWPNVQFDEYGSYEGINYAGWLQETQNWILNRADWIDEEITTLIYAGSCNNTLEENTLMQKELLVTDWYPNPFNDKLSLEVQANQFGFITVKVFTVLGQQVFTENYQLVPGSNTLNILLDKALPAGSYMLQVTQETKLISIQKIVKAL